MRKITECIGRVSCERCSESLIGYVRVTEKLGQADQQDYRLCYQCYRKYELGQLNLRLVCRMCSADLSGSVDPDRLVCGRCESRLRLRERRIKLVNKCRE